jgi:alanine racemase
VDTRTIEAHPDERPYAWADVDLGAIEYNAALLRGRAGVDLCAVVKGWGYGHGIDRAALAAVRGGATWLGVALVSEAIDVRERTQLTEPVLLLAEPHPRELVDVVRIDGVRPTLYSAEAIRATAKAVRDVGRAEPLPVHLKVDTGMHRVGAAPEAAVHLAEMIASSDELELEGFWTHLAAADDPAEDAFTAEQLRRFESVRQELAAAGIRPPLLHVANSGAALAHPEARYDLVRCGIALYGIAPRAGMPEAAGLRPAMALRARVSHVKRVPAGETVSYGRHHRCTTPTVIATVPIGYYDGVPRRLGLVGGEVLIGGRRRPVVGAVTMDQLMVDCGDDGSVRVRDEVVLFGSQGDETISAWDWAERLDTIAYEIVCSISINRVPRRYTDTRSPTC